jgi:stage V sporulation protein G
MIITDVKILLASERQDKLRGFACITIDRCFVVRDIKIIQGSRLLFIAMPSRKITDRCSKCQTKNHLQAQFCNRCGGRLSAKRVRPDGRGRAKLHADIAHPINAKTRKQILQVVLKSYHAELARSRKPGYVPPVFEEDFDEADYDDIPATPVHGTPAVEEGPEYEAEETQQRQQPDRAEKNNEGKKKDM